MSLKDSFDEIDQSIDGGVMMCTSHKRKCTQSQSFHSINIDQIEKLPIKWSKLSNEFVFDTFQYADAATIDGI